MTVGGGDRVCAYIGIGSNLNEPQRQVLDAVQLLKLLPGCKLRSVSSLYQSAAFGPIEQDDFINAVVALETSLPAEELLCALKEIERAQGRNFSAERWGPRVLDLDILVYGEHLIELPDLQIPHPGIGERNFVLLPLREIAPELAIPGLGRVFDILVNEHEPSIKRII